MSQPPIFSNRPRLSLLIVDDQRVAARVLARLLEALGHTAQVAFSGAEALHCLSATRVDAVISDIGMPGMNGYELARAIRVNPQFQRLPLIALTGRDDPDDHRAAATAGFNACLTKPADLRTLRQALDAIPHSSAGGDAVAGSLAP